MMTSFFDQFMSPTQLGLPLIFIALTTPWVLISSPTKQWMNNRINTLQTWTIFSITKQLLSPMNFMGQKWALMLMSLMLFLMMLNILGLLPYTFTPTTQLSLNMALAVPLWLSTVLLGFRHQLTTSLGHLLPEGTPTLLIPTLIIIETISLFIRPLALGVRLTANLTAGHLLIQLIATASVVLLSSMPSVALLTMMVLFLLTLLEIAVAMIQAYVFVLLLTLYLQENI
uniref:ATP synthase subunit a n=1 Tax=Boulengerula boulengeri TaxID=260983 RepID=C9D873_BOUBO|nr:ATP synthase F0 subunit 6 [Boulengerula boulengeri]ACS37006.1 ATP synthase F0 subunit 6 [Boulengerula boulengeri]